MGSGKFGNDRCLRGAVRDLDGAAVYEPRDQKRAALRIAAVMFRSDRAPGRRPLGKTCLQEKSVPVCAGTIRLDYVADSGPAGTGEDRRLSDCDRYAFRSAVCQAVLRRIQVQRIPSGICRRGDPVHVSREHFGEGRRHVRFTGCGDREDLRMADRQTGFAG